MGYSKENFSEAVVQWFKIELVMMDPPYGKTQEVWDTKFEKEDFEQSSDVFAG